MARQTKQQIADQLAIDAALVAEQQAILKRMRAEKRASLRLRTQPHWRK